MPPYLYIRHPSAFMRLSPHAHAPVSDEVLYGTTVFLRSSQTKNGFVRCETSYGYCGYLPSSALSAEMRSDGQKMLVTAPFADVLPSPRYRERPLVTVPRGAVLRLSRDTQQGDRFAAVHIGKRIGYVPRASLRTFPKPCTSFPLPLRKAVCDDALSYLGTPYRYGGKSASGIDCSGLCFMAYFLNGLPLWRDSSPDRRFVHEIGREDLLPADLICFKGHIALYIGGGEYVHASASAGFVTVNSLTRGSILYRHDLAASVVCFARSNVGG